MWFCCRNRRLLVIFILLLSFLAFYDKVFKKIGFFQTKLNILNDNKTLKLFDSLDVFILDIHFLNEILFSEEHEHHKLSLEKHFSFIKNSQIKSENYHITFGLFEEFIEPLRKYTKLKNDYNCEVLEANGLHGTQKVLTNIYYKCRGLIMQFAIFYRRSTFYWVGADSPKLHESKWFGDVPRAVNKFDLKTLLDSNSIILKYPKNLKTFLFDYGHSKFYECNRTAANYIKNNYGGKYAQNETLNNMISPCFKHTIQTVESLYKRYWLASGTLLGWYRDCGIIPHTQDIDLAMYSDEYDRNLKESFLGKGQVRIWLTLGTVKNNFELRMSGCKFTFDIFMIYKYPEKKQQCNGYHIKKIFPQCLPLKTDLCSAQLLDMKVIIPCEPESYLINQYGDMKQWIIPEAVYYAIPSIDWPNGITRPLSLWPYMYRYYHYNGKRDEFNSLKAINNVYPEETGKGPLTKLPDDDDQYI